MTAADKNSTNLALKGIIAIGAMGEMSRANGNGSDAQLYGVKHPAVSGFLSVPH